MLVVYCRSDDDDDGTEYHCDGSRFVFLFVCLFVCFFGLFSSSCLCLYVHSCCVFYLAFIQSNVNLRQLFFMIEVRNLLHVHVCVSALLVILPCFVVQACHWVMHCK